MMSIVISNIKELEKKILIMIINGLLGFYISLQFTNLNFSYIILGLSAAISILIGEILLPIFLATSVVTLNLNLFKEIVFDPTSLTVTSIEKIIVLLILLIIVPFVHLIARKNPRALITSGALALQFFNPTYPLILYFSGISFNENIIDSIFSSFPYIYLLFTYNIHTALFVIVFSFIGSILYSISKSYYSLVGVGPVAIASYYAYLMLHSNFIYYAIILSLAINTLDKFVKTTQNIRQNKQALMSLKDKLNERIKNINAVLYSLKTQIGKEKHDFSTLVENSLKMMSDIQNKLAECNNMNCITNIENELKNQERILTVEVNNYIFDMIRSYNEFVENLKKQGINLGEIEYPKEEISLLDFPNFYKQLKQSIDSNVLIASNIINNIIDNIVKLLGKNIDKVVVINEDQIIQKLNSINLDEINKLSNACLNKSLEIISIFNTEDEDYKLRKDLADITSQPISTNKLSNAIKILERINNILIVNLSTMYNNLKTINSMYNLTELDSLQDLINVELQTLQTSDMPYCQKISRLYNSISELKEAIDISNNKDTLTQLNELVDTILPQIMDSGEISLSDLGINEKYGKYIVALLNKKGFKVELNNDKIIIKLKYNQ